MSLAPELPSLGLAAFLVGVGGPVLARGLVLFARAVPPAAEVRAGWRFVDLLAVVAMLVLATQGFVLVGGGTGPLGELVTMQFGLAAAGGAAFGLARARAQGAAALGCVRPAEARTYAGALALYAPLFFAFLGLSIAWAHVARHYGWPERQEVLERVLALEGRALLACAVLATLVGPFLEELLFRGFLQGVLCELLGARAGLVVTAVLFASLHGRAGLPGLLLLSLVLGWLRARSGSFFVSFVVHALHNGLTLALALGAGIR